MTDTNIFLSKEILSESTTATPVFQKPVLVFGSTELQKKIGLPTQPVFGLSEPSYSGPSASKNIFGAVPLIQNTSASIFGGTGNQEGKSKNVFQINTPLVTSATTQQSKSLVIDESNKQLGIFGSVTTFPGSSVTISQHISSSSIFGGENISRSSSQENLFPKARLLFNNPQLDLKISKKLFGSDNEIQKLPNKQSGFLNRKPEDVKETLNKSNVIKSNKVAFENELNKPNWSQRVSSLETFPYVPESLHKPEEKSSSSKKDDVFSLETKPTTIIAAEISPQLLDKSILKNHFRKFGKVIKVHIKENSNQASVQFENHESATEAKIKGKSIHPKFQEMKLFFGNPLSKKKKDKMDKKEKYESNKSAKVSLKPAVKFSTSQTKSQDSNIKSLASVTSSKLFQKSIGSIFQDKNDKFTKSYGKSIFDSSKSSTYTVPKVFGNQASNNLLQEHEKKQKPPPEYKKSNTSSCKAPSDNIVAAKDFNSLIKNEASNNYDKFMILDARDKHIRSKLKKVTDVEEAEYLVASCPDMCPEKERYSRDIQFNVSSLEKTDGEMDPQLMIKTFSRSSADKDEPLPHELRPGSVLKMTMDFLICNILSKVDKVPVDIWYNYLLNRTRGLRNDITQQHLRDSNAVYVLERCVRFHIHCSHSLCEETIDNFDPKINREHLSKSIQSLKELYHDLGEKGIYYTTESEFRAYEILLGVNDGNIFFKYLNFKESVRKSKEVQFAIKVLTSIHINNYNTFFRLLKHATYLQACAMHQHFKDVRLKALPVIMRSYFGSIQIDSIMNMLGFSDNAKVINYLAYFGVDVDDDCLVISKGTFVPAPDNVPSVCPSKVITSALKSSVAEVIHNGKLPENPFSYYKPHDSFDVMGYLKNESKDAKDQTPKKVQKHVSNVDYVYFATPDLEEKVSSNERENKEELKLMSEDKLAKKELESDSIIKEIITKDFSSAKSIAESETVGETVYEEDYAAGEEDDEAWEGYEYIEGEEEMENEFDEDFLEEEEKKEKMAYEEFILRDCIKNWKNFIEMRKNKKKEIAGKFLAIWKKYAMENSRKNAQLRKYLLSKYFLKWYKRIQFLKKMRKYKIKCKLIESRILERNYFKKWKENCAYSKSIKISSAVRNCLLLQKYFFKWLLQTQVLREERRSLEFYSLKLLRAAFNKWVDYVERKKIKSQRKQQESFPSVGFPLSPEEQNELLSWNYYRDISLDLTSLQISNLDKEINTNMQKVNTKENLSTLISWSALPLIYRFKQSILCRKSVTKNIFDRYFKILILTHRSTETYLLSWLRTKFNISGDGDISKPLQSFSTYFSCKGNTHCVLIREENVDNFDDINVDGCSLIILASNTEIVLENSSEIEGIPHLNLQWGEEFSELSKNYLIFNKSGIDSAVSSEVLFNFVFDTWLLRGEKLNLEISNFYSLMGSCVSKHILCPIYDEIYRRREFNRASLVPEIIVGAYNDLISHLKLCLEFSKSNSLKYIPSEILENKMSNESTFIQNLFVPEVILMSATLPRLEIEPENFSDNDFWNYIHKVAESSDWNEGLISEIEIILRNHFDNGQKGISEEISYYNIPWVKILVCCIFYKLSLIPDIDISVDIGDINSFDSDGLWKYQFKSSAMLSSKPVSEAVIKRKDVFPIDLEPKKSKSFEPDRSKIIISDFIDEILVEKEKVASFENEINSMLMNDFELRQLCDKYEINSSEFGL